jgi:type II secretory pathway pseudopilin PulG
MSTAPSRAPRHPPAGADGFTIVEAVVALSLLLVVMVGMIATIDAGVKGARIGRQRSAATAAAQEAIESMRSLAYDALGHDYAGDPTMSSDPALLPVGDHTTFEGEDLVGASGGAAVLDPHQHEVSSDGTRFRRSVYVTWPQGSAKGGSSKRVTAVVGWDTGLGGATGRIAEIRVSTLVDASGAASPLAGSAEVDAALPALTVTGVVDGKAVQARVVLPAANSRLVNDATPSATSLADSVVAELVVPATSPTGCAVASGLTSCGPGRLRAASDASADTMVGDQAQVGPMLAAGGAGGAGSLAYQIDGGGTSTVSSFIAAGSGAGDADGRPWLRSTASAPSLMNLSLRPLGLVGQLFRTTSAGSATGIVDVDPVGSANWVTVTGATHSPTLALAAFAGPVDRPGYDGAVRVSAFDLGATAAVGAGAPPATLTGSPVTLELYDDAAGPGYRCYRVMPATGAVTDCAGAPAAVAATATTVNLGAGYSAGISTRTTVAPGATSGELVAGGRVAAGAGAPGWLQVDVHLDLFRGATTVASLDLHLDAGHLALSATGRSRS